MKGVPEDRKYQIQAVRNRHHEIVRLVVLGWDNKRIAKQLGIGAQNVSDVKNSPLGARSIMILQARRDANTVSLAKMLENDVPKNFDLIMQVRDGSIKSDSDLYIPIQLRMLAATKLLDREGYGPTKSVTGKFVHAFLTGDDIEDIKKRADVASANASQQARIDGLEVAEAEVIKQERVPA